MVCICSSPHKIYFNLEITLQLVSIIRFVVEMIKKYIDLIKYTNRKKSFLSFFDI